MARILDPGRVFKDTTGNLLSGGKIYFYTSGTTTLKATYSDASLSTQNDNPITLNSAGRLPVEVFGTGSYTVRAVDANNALAWTEDDVRNDSADADYNQGGTGATDRTVKNKLQDIVSVFDYMTSTEIADVRAGGGGVDVSAAVQAAIDDVDTPGQTLVLPAGDYLFSSTVTVAASDIKLLGLGRARILNGQTNAPALTIGDGVTTYHRIGVDGLTFGSASGITAVSGNIGLKIDNIQHGVFENLYFFDFSAALFNALWIEDSTTNYFHNIQAQNGLGTNVVIQDAVDVYFSDSRSDGSAGNGFSIIDSEGMYFSNITSWNNDRGFHIRETVANDSVNMFFENCIGDTSLNHNWQIDALINGVFSNCWGGSHQDTTTNVTACGFFMDVDCNDLHFSNCIGISGNAHGFHVANAAIRISFSNCAGKENGSAAGSAGSGFAIINGVDCLVTGCISAGNDRYGIEVGASSTGFKASNNQLLNNTLADVVDNSTGAIITNNTGWITEASGTGEIANGTTSDVITHGLSVTPTLGQISIIGGENPTNDVGTIWVDTITSTTLVVNCENDPGASGWDFGWKVTAV